jgi:exopolysaccharide biosynthesis polyprenyl glycosylphosphotransferase
MGNGVNQGAYEAPGAAAAWAGTELAGAAEATASRRTAVIVAADVTAIAASSILAVVLMRVFASLHGFDRGLGAFVDLPRGGIVTVIALVPLWLFVLYAFGMYSQTGRVVAGHMLSEGTRGFTALTVGIWVLLVSLLIIEGDDASLGYLIVFWMVAVVAVPLSRWLARAVAWQGPRFKERTLIVGAGSVGHLLAHKIANHPEYRLDLVGFLDDGDPVGPTDQSVPVVGGLADLSAVIRQRDIRRVIIAFSRARHQQILDVVRTCSENGVRVNIVPRLFEILSSQTAVDDVEGIPLLNVATVELSRFNMIVKRCFDLVVGGLLTLVALPLIAALALAIKLDSPGPVFFRQERMGRDGRVFRIFKLRSMRVDAERQRYELADQNDYSGPMFKMKRDPRVTRVGSFIRLWSLDEIPQLFNVMAGHMSLVGPRPLWVDEAARCRGWTKKRLGITPGITGLWQVTGRNDVPFDEMVKLDYMYVTGWSLSWDVRLLLETIPAVLGRRGAY